MPFHSNVRVRCSQGALQEAFAGNVAVAITYYNAARASAQSKDFVFGDFRGKKTECPAYLVSVCVCTAAAKTCHCYRRQTLRAPTVYRSRTVSVDHPFVLHSTSLSLVLSSPLPSNIVKGFTFSFLSASFQMYLALCILRAHFLLSALSTRARCVHHAECWDAH